MCGIVDWLRIYNYIYFEKDVTRTFLCSAGT